MVTPIKGKTFSKGNGWGGRTLARVALGFALVFALNFVAEPAMAFTTNGCSWSTGALRLDVRNVNGNFLSAIHQAATNYNSATHVSLNVVTVSGPAFTADNASYGATGWEGSTSWLCIIDTNYAHMHLNQYYLTGLEPVTRLKVVWEHEMGHALGIGHVPSVLHVMYQSASQAYFAGVTGLTTDEINGINSLY